MKDNAPAALVAVGALLCVLFWLKVVPPLTRAQIRAEHRRDTYQPLI